MVDKVNQIIRENQPSSRPGNGASKNVRSTDPSGKVSKADSNSNSAEDSNKVNFNINEQVAEMAKEAPLDMEKVSKIKNAIAEGSYPIDLERISESLMQAYSEFK
tara:strand:- start:55 stop:369 length:315 start_codon:yes stop_codon:yes gene_type:complete